MIELEKNQRVLLQWTLDQKVILDGFQAGTRVEFSLKYDCKETSLPVTAYELDGHVVAEIPNVLLQSCGYLHVEVVPSVGDADHTPEEKDFRIVKRERPEDYDANYTETPTQSMANKIDRYWGKENRGKVLAVGSDGIVYAKRMESGGGGGTATDLEVDEETLLLEDGFLSVNTADAAIKDDTRPITSGAVYEEFSKAVALLKTI